MKFIRYLITIITLSVALIVPCSAGVFTWMESTLPQLSTLFQSCLTVPPFNNFSISAHVLPVQSSGLTSWIPTGVEVQKDKLIKFSWSTRGIEPKPRRYVVLYRIDPRFIVPQVFIKEVDYTGDTVFDFEHFKNGQLVKYQNNSIMTFHKRIMDYTDYFNFQGRNKIPIYSGDVINITLGSAGVFFGSESIIPLVYNNTEFNRFSWFTNEEIASVFTPSSGIDNEIIYASADTWCDALNNSTVDSSMVCANHTYKFSDAPLDVLYGDLKDEYKFHDIKDTLQSCPTGANTMSLNSLCIYDQGRGMRITANGEVIKKTEDKFVYSDFLQKYFLYYKASSSGTLDISTDWQISNMFVNFSQFMNTWDNFAQVSDIMDYVHSDSSVDLSAKFLHFGRYIMIIEIGNGDYAVSQEDLNSIEVEYGIADSNSLVDSTKFVIFGQSSKILNNQSVDADKDGYLWLKVDNTNTNLDGELIVNISTYTGSTWFSTILYDKIISEIRNKVLTLTKTFYTELINNPQLKQAAQALLIIYVIMYGLFFMVGAIEIKALDGVVRVVKIVIVVTLFGPNSWTFFNDHLFSMFTEGIEYLMTLVIGMPGSNNNIFGFIDPIFDRYSNPQIWSLLAIQLLQIHTGLTFFAIMVIYGLLGYLRSVIEVIVGYCIALIVIAVMISLAPFFITFMLFERTRGMFDNWLSLLFSYTISPTILLILFLIVDQLVSTQINQVVFEACWDCFIPIQLGLDLTHIGIPLNFSFKLPFLDCIPFYMTNVPDGSYCDADGNFMRLAVSSFLFFIYCSMSSGMISYVNMITAQLTNVMPARQEGDVQKPNNPIESVISDMNKIYRPVKSIATSPIRVFKSKVIDQKYRVQSGSDKDKSDKPNYAGRISSGSRHDNP